MTMSMESMRPHQWPNSRDCSHLSVLTMLAQRVLVLGPEPVHGPEPELVHVPAPGPPLLPPMYKHFEYSAMPADSNFALKWPNPRAAVCALDWYCRMHYPSNVRFPHFAIVDGNEWHYSIGVAVAAVVGSINHLSWCRRCAVGTLSLVDTCLKRSYSMMLMPNCRHHFAVLDCVLNAWAPKLVSTMVISVFQLVPNQHQTKIAPVYCHSHAHLPDFHTTNGDDDDLKRYCCPNHRHSTNRAAAAAVAFSSHAAYDLSIWSRS